MADLIEQACDLSLADAGYPVCRRAGELMNAAMWEACGGACVRDAGRLLADAVALHYRGILGDFDGEVRVSDGSTGLQCALFHLLGRRVRAYRGLVSRCADAYVDTDGVAGPLALSAFTGYSVPCALEKEDVALIYLCSPSPVTGEALPRRVLEEWVAFAAHRGCVLVLDTTLTPFVLSDGQANRYPRSVFCIEGADGCCAELLSLSPRWSAGLDAGAVVTAGACRCALSAVESRMRYGRASGTGRDVGACRLSDYVLMRAAAGVFEPESEHEILSACRCYLERIRAVAAFLAARGLECGVCGASPFLLVRGAKTLTSMGIQGRDAATLSGAFCGFSVLSGF